MKTAFNRLLHRIKNIAKSVGLSIGLSVAKSAASAAIVILAVTPASLLSANDQVPAAPILLAAADTSRLLPLTSIASPDALISKALQDIRASRMDDALREVNRAIALRPDFKLAHLIRGDLLTARMRPLAGLGAASKVPSASLDDLRDEARVRLLRYIDQPAADLLPRQILQLAPQQKYALLADTSRARLYLFENIDGVPRLKSDFYMTIGKNGTDKRVEGDKRTPMGVYQITEQLPRAGLADLYGDGAYPLDYPNEWDRMQGHGGHGIWLHGVPSNTYSRPPRSSDGCVVVANPDLKELSRWIKVGSTPVIITDRTDWISQAEWEQSRDNLMAQLNRWKSDWEARDPDRFLLHYSSNMTSGKGAAWAKDKRRNILGKEWIRINLSNISLFLYGNGDMAYAEFTQSYSSNTLSSVSSKRLYWQMQQGTWRVALEKTQDTPTSNKLAQR
jgi:murein L,D-transpeptidase YafK